MSGDGMPGRAGGRAAAPARMEDCYFPFFTGEHARRCRGMGLAERGALVELMCLQWDRGPFRDDDAFIARALGVRVDVWRRWAPSIRPLFESLEGGLLAMGSLEKSRRKVGEISALRASVGSLGGKAKSLKSRGAAVANATLLPGQMLGNSEASNSKPTPSLRSGGAGAAPGAAADVPPGGAPPPAPPPADDPPPPADLFGNGPSPPGPHAALHAEAPPKLVAVGAAPPSGARGFLGLLLKEAGGDVAVVRDAVRAAHDLWTAGEALAEPRSWLIRAARRRGGGEARRGPEAPPARVLPAEVNGWRVGGCVDEYGRIMHADCEGAWPGFTRMLVECLEAGAEPERDLEPVMRAAARRGVRTIDGPGWFRAAVMGRLADRAAA